jgi:hypothetical protein
MTERDRRHRPNDEPVPPSSESQSELVDEESEESFPASDPPSSWARPTDSDHSDDEGAG